MLLRLLIALFVSLALRAADAPALSPVTFYADWFPGAQFAGIYVAIDRGYYRDAGLAVHDRALRLWPKNNRAPRCKAGGLQRSHQRGLHLPPKTLCRCRS